MGREQRKRTWLLSRMNLSTKARTVDYAQEGYLKTIDRRSSQSDFATQWGKESSSTAYEALLLYGHATTRRSSAHFDGAFSNANR